MLNGKKILRTSIFGIFGYLFMSGNVFATTLNMNVGETYNYNGVSITCDNNGNCTSTIGDENFLGLAQNSNLGDETQVVFWNENQQLGYLKNNNWSHGVWQRYVDHGCFVDYTQGTTFEKYLDTQIQGCTDTTGAFTSRIENASIYAGKLTSLRFNTFGSQNLICWNYNEDLGSFCTSMADNQQSTATDYGMTRPVTIEKINAIATTTPFVGGGDGGDDEETTINYACPTIQQLINTYPSQYNTGLCYSSSLIFSGGTIQQVEPKDIFNLYPQYTGFVADINLYNNYCVGPNTQTACETAFQGKTEQYTLISKIPDNVKKANLYAYCNLQLNYEDKNASTCVTSGAINTGEYIPPITNQGVIDELINGDYNIVLPASGYVMDTLKDENGERKIDWNIIESIQNLYSKFTTIFTGREGNNGIIPEYITRMLLVIILFAFFKK